MDRRDFLKAAAALPAIAVVPALAESPGMEWVDVTVDLAGLGCDRTVWAVITKVSEHGRVLKDTGDIPVKAQYAAYAEWRREVQEMGERLGLEIVEERYHYFPAGVPDKVDPLGQWACFTANFTLGRRG